ncbi:hypothetical protein G5B35_16470 [Parapusillimonas sp. SGNA-6]|nr:hypothetical protein [Parapusillimonas sp. SGNA-6]
MDSPAIGAPAAGRPRHGVNGATAPFIKAAGFTDDALDRPIIGIAATGSAYNPCHGNAPQLIEASISTSCCPKARMARFRLPAGPSQRGPE